MVSVRCTILDDTAEKLADLHAAFVCRTFTENETSKTNPAQQYEQLTLDRLDKIGFRSTANDEMQVIKVVAIPKRLNPMQFCTVCQAQKDREESMLYFVHNTCKSKSSNRPK